MIEPPDEFKTGVRLLMRVWRNKDKTEGKRPGHTLISQDVKTWNASARVLLDECIPGERVYASVDARDVDKAIRLFKERQLVADYDATDVRHQFYHQCETRWLSCLGSPRASATQHFLFDCDDEIDERRTRSVLGLKMLGYEPIDVAHSYRTRSGSHIITRPFNPERLPEEVGRLLQKNSLLLVGWCE